jgi:CubicO group peptidase (beta-lactamase class C family)
MKTWTAILAAAVAGLASPALAQQPPQQPLARPEPPRHAAASAASSRAINLCSGLWSAGQTREMIERDLIGPDRPDATPLKTEIDEAKKTVSITYDESMPPRIVVWRPVMGCVQLPIGATIDAARHLPQVDAKAPNLDHQPWPMGDRDATARLPAARQAAIDGLVEAAFDGKTYGGTTWGVIVLVDGKIVAERYDRGFGPHIGSQTHSAAKSFASTLAGIAIGQRKLSLSQAPALKEWTRPGDPRGAISVEHLMRMASGLYGEGTGSPQGDIYSQGATVADRAATNHLDTLPGTRFLYNPPDTMLLMRAVRQGLGDDRRYFAYPWSELFWKIGMTRTTTSSDWGGDFLMSGQTFSTARDFARFGLLYLNDGVWLGRRLLPEGWAKTVSTAGPAQPAGTGPRYGGQFWLYGGQSGLPADAYSPNGGQGQYAMIVPSRKVVVVRRGYDAGGGFQIAKFSADVLAALAAP